METRMLPTQRLQPGYVLRNMAHDPDDIVELGYVLHVEPMILSGIPMTGVRYLDLSDGTMGFFAVGDEVPVAEGADDRELHDKIRQGFDLLSDRIDASLED